MKAILRGITPVLLGAGVTLMLLAAHNAAFNFGNQNSGGTGGESTSEGEGGATQSSFFSSLFGNMTSGSYFAVNNTKAVEEVKFPPEVLSMSVCISIKKNSPEKGMEKQEKPSPTCKRWGIEGSQDDIFFPANEQTAINHFKYLHELVNNFSPTKECLSEIKRVPLHQYKRVLKDFEKDVVFPAYWGDELELVIKTLIHLRPKSYFEWGAGGSSRWFTSLVSEKAISVDNFKPWCDKVREDPYVKCMEANGKFGQYCADPKTDDNGQTQVGFGAFKGDENTGNAMAKDFVDAIDNFNRKIYDVILVDGRFRQACALKALNYLNEGSVLIFHDFWSRPQYHFILDYYDAIGRSRSAATLRRKPVDQLPEGWKKAYIKYSNLAYQK